MAAWSSEEGAPRARGNRTDWAAVAAWAAGTGLCLAVWAAVFLIFYFGLTA